MHWGNVAKLGALLAVEGVLLFFKVQVPPEVTALVGTLVAGIFPSVVKGWAP